MSVPVTDIEPDFGGNMVGYELRPRRWTEWVLVLNQRKWPVPVLHWTDCPSLRLPTGGLQFLPALFEGERARLTRGEKLSVFFCKHCMIPKADA